MGGSITGKRSSTQGTCRYSNVLAHAEVISSFELVLDGLRLVGHSLLVRSAWKGAAAMLEARRPIDE
jgi:hypothetical protein